MNFIKKNKKVILLILFILIIVLLFYINNNILDNGIKSISNNKIEEESKITDIKKNEEVKEKSLYKIEQNYQKQILEIYKLNKNEYKKINEYMCEDKNCGVGSPVQGLYYFNEPINGIFVIHDNEKIVLFNAEKGILGKYGVGISSALCYDENLCLPENIIYLYIKDPKEEKYGIIDLNGNIIKEFILEKTPFRWSDGILNIGYSIKENMYVDVIDDKYGVIELVGDKVIIDYNYEMIKLVPGKKRFKGKKNGKWYLIDFANEQKIINEGYDDLFVVNDEILLARIDDYLYIKDYGGNNLINEKIQLYVDEVKDYSCCGANTGLGFKLENNILTLYVDEDYSPEAKVLIYEYNIVERTLLLKEIH